MRGLARERLPEAIRLWARSDSWDAVADLLDRMPEVIDDPDDAKRFVAAASRLRDGSISVAEALATLDVPPT